MPRDAFWQLMHFYPIFGFASFFCLMWGCTALNWSWELSPEMVTPNAVATQRQDVVTPGAAGVWGGDVVTPNSAGEWGEDAVTPDVAGVQGGNAETPNPAGVWAVWDIWAV